MMIALTAEETLPSEMDQIHGLFKEGLALLHLRKYHLSDEQMEHYIASIDITYHNRLVLHSHPHLSVVTGIQRIHLNRRNRESFQFDRHISGCTYSTSVHHIDEFNALSSNWDYAFLSPLFPSVSKIGYGQHTNVISQLKLRTNKDVHVVGLGGVRVENCQIPLSLGANGIALYGALWQAPDPIQYFITCKQKYSNDYSIFHKG